MSSMTIPAHFDGERIQLDEPVELELNARLLVTVISAEEEERGFWHRLSAIGLARAYSDDEPEYTDADIKEWNPEYKGW